jgi:hypothetical protein
MPAPSKSQDVVQTAEELGNHVQLAVRGPADAEQGEVWDTVIRRGTTTLGDVEATALALWPDGRLLVVGDRLVRLPSGSHTVRDTQPGEDIEAVAFSATAPEWRSATHRDALPCGTAAPATGSASCPAPSRPLGERDPGSRQRLGLQPGRRHRRRRRRLREAPTPGHRQSAAARQHPVHLRRRHQLSGLHPGRRRPLRHQPPRSSPAPPRQPLRRGRADLHLHGHDAVPGPVAYTFPTPPTATCAPPTVERGRGAGTGLMPASPVPCRRRRSPLGPPGPARRAA